MSLVARFGLGFSGIVSGLRSPLFYMAFMAGFFGLAVPGAPWPRNWGWFLTAPFLEEFTWRALLQNELARWMPEQALFSRANILSSAAFACAHVVVAPGLMALLTFFPSLIFGLIWTRFHSLWLCGLIHLWYNVAQRL